MNKMNIGDRVYHKNLKRYGIFKGTDTDPTACFVEFDADEYGVVDELCVTQSQLDKVESETISINSVSGLADSIIAGSHEPLDECKKYVDGEEW